MTTDHDPVTFLERRLDPTFEKRTVSIAPESSRAYDPDEWRDAIVVVERGEIEFETTAGRRRRFVSGDILCLDGLSLRALHNPGREVAVLVTVSRRWKTNGCADQTYSP